MQAQTARETNLGLIALALSGLLFALGIILRGPVELDDPGACCRAAPSAGYVSGWTIILVGGVLHLFGLFGLYRYLTDRRGNAFALPALVLAVVGVALVIPLATFLAVHGPVIADLYQQGARQVIAVAEASFRSALGLALVGVSSACGTIGAFLFAVAIWRDGRLPRWTGVSFALSVALLAVPVTFGTELLGAVLLLIAAAVMWWKGYVANGIGADGSGNSSSA
ncbi:MAG: hypothetical protein ACRDHD_00545 [Candidatus Limnocylindria bacterium]